MFMLLLDPRNSNQPTTQGRWRYTSCGNKICSCTYIGSADTCPIPISSGIERTPRMRSSPMLVPTYIVLFVNDNGTYSNVRVSKDVIFDESVVFDKYIDNSPTDEEFAALPHI